MCVLQIQIKIFVDAAVIVCYKKTPTVYAVIELGI